MSENFGSLAVGFVVMGSAALAGIWVIKNIRDKTEDSNGDVSSPSGKPRSKKPYYGSCRGLSTVHEEVNTLLSNIGDEDWLNKLAQYMNTKWNSLPANRKPKYVTSICDLLDSYRKLMSASEVYSDVIKYCLDESLMSPDNEKILQKLQGELLEFEFKGDALFIYAEGDRELAIQIKLDLERMEVNGENCVCTLPDEDENGKPMLQRFETVFFDYRYIFVLATANMKEDVLTRYKSEMCITDSFQEKLKEFRVLPVWPYKKKDNIMELKPIPGLQYFDYKQAEECHRFFTNSFKRLIQNGRELFRRELPQV